MSSDCGNCDCADKSQCTKKRNSFGLEIVESSNYSVSFEGEMGNAVAENDFKCGPGCKCNSCSCHSS